MIAGLATIFRKGNKMNEPDYEYRGLVARGWDFMREDMDFADRPFFHLLISNNGEPALDVGCSTGRLLLDFRAAGLDIDGLDISPEMVARCKQKAAEQSLTITIYNQAMEEIDLPRKYRTIIVPSMSFQLVTDLDDAKKALANFFDHLLPGGILAMAIRHISSEGTDEWGDWSLVVEKEGYEGDKTFKRWERSMYDADTQLRHTENRYHLIQDGKIVYREFHHRSPELRNYSLGQLTTMLEQTGFTGVHVVSGLANEPAGEDDGTFYIIGSKNQGFA